MHSGISIAVLSAAAIALTLGGCGKAGSSKGASDPDSVKAAIKKDESKWNQDFKAKDSEGLSSHYADDAYFVAPGLVPADGSTAIRQVYANGTTDPAFNVEFASDKIDVSSGGDMAYARGHFSEKYTDKKNDKVMSTSGSYITVYKKQDDGSWKVVEDFAAADPDATKPVPAEKPATRAKMVSSGF
jgi:uncharacterized protein (TIGR02246 family)